MSSDDEPQDPAPQRGPGPITVMKAKDELDRERAREEREAAEKRDARQDGEKMELTRMALGATDKALAGAQRSIKYLYMLLAASMLANIVLTGMYLNKDVGVDVTAEGVKLNSSASQPPE